MLSQLRSRRDGPNGGFSLVELLVVVAILAILAAIAIPLFLNQKGKAMMGTLRSDSHNVLMGVESARQSDGTFGTTESVRVAIVETVGKITSPNTIWVWMNCAQNTAGTAVERSPGNYILQGYRDRAPAGGSWATGTTGLTYNSKTQTWAADGVLYNQIWAVGNPCWLANGGSGNAAFTYNASNVFQSSVG